MLSAASCYVIGETLLLTECLETLLAEAYTVLAVVSQHPKAKQFCERHHLTYYSDLSEFLKNCATTQADYLFSIMNLQYLNAKLLALAKRCINYHDSLLPRYAGVNATAWAIEHQETKHGITWHEMQPQLDAGRVLMQQTIAVDKSETSLSLNLKCSQAAVSSFHELLGQLLAGTDASIEQDLSQRNYYGKAAKFPGNAWVDWSERAEVLERRSRALYFGDYLNSLGCMVFQVEGEAYIIERLTFSDEISCVLGGYITRMENGTIQVCSANDDVKIHSLRFINGIPCSIERFVIRHQLILGKRFDSPTQEEQQAYQRISSECVKDEAFWVGQLSQAQANSFPCLAHHDNYRDNAAELVTEFKLSTDEWFKGVVAQENSLPLAEMPLLALLFVWYHRLSGETAIRFDILQQESIYPEESAPFFASYRPLVAQLSATSVTAYDCLQQLVVQYSLLESRQGFLQHIYARYPSLAGCQETGYIAVSFTALSTKQLKALNHPIIVVLEGQHVRIYVKSLARNNDLLLKLGECANQLALLASDLVNAPHQAIADLSLSIDHKKINSIGIK